MLYELCFQLFFFLHTNLCEFALSSSSASCAEASALALSRVALVVVDDNDEGIADMTTATSFRSVDGFLRACPSS